MPSFHPKPPPQKKNKRDKLVSIDWRTVLTELAKWRENLTCGLCQGFVTHPWHTKFWLSKTYISHVLLVTQNGKNQDQKLSVLDKMLACAQNGWRVKRLELDSQLPKVISKLALKERGCFAKSPMELTLNSWKKYDVVKSYNKWAPCYYDPFLCKQISTSEHDCRGDQHGGMHTNERSHVKLITIGSNGPYGRR